IGPDPRNFNQRVSLGRNDLLIRTFPNGEWRVYDIDRKVNISTMNKDTAFDEWKAEAKKQHNS
ncbi:hypothetical protein AIZ13_25010, partial [Salmonella enterica subsp. enterica serovar Typhimurium]